MKVGANSFHLAGIGSFCKTTAGYFCYVPGWPEELHLDTISSSSDLLALFSEGSTAPCEQESQGPNGSFTPGAAKCQNKVVFVSEWFVLYSAGQKAKVQRSLSILGQGKLQKLKTSQNIWLGLILQWGFFRDSVESLLSPALLIKAAVQHDRLFPLSSFHFAHFQIFRFCEENMIVKRLY